MRLTYGSLFAGIGGIDLGLDRAGHECRWQVEADPFCARILAAHWPDVRRYGDIRTVDGIALEPVDLIVGGFPCQDLSSAHTNGRRRGLAGPQSSLWHGFARVVAEVGPRWVVAENVAAWRAWVPSVRAELARLRYASLPVEVSAGQVGAPHRRPRVFVVADADSDSESLRALHAEVARLPPVPIAHGHWRTPPSRGFRVDDGIPRGLERCAALGNAVVPQVAEVIGRWLATLADS